MLPVALAEFDFANLERLIAAGGLRESRTLDFKRDAVGPKEDDKREFLCDVSAFANTAGGDMVFGVDESQGEATDAPGAKIDDPDAEIRRLEAVLRTGLEPRLAGVEMCWAPRPGGGGALLVRIPRSFAAPHRVTLRDHAKFYARNSVGKYPLDVGELRSAFLSADTLVQRIRRFRVDRLAAIGADEGAMPLEPGAKVVLHILPLSSFADDRNDIVVKGHEVGLFPMMPGTSGFSRRYALEGHCSFFRADEATGRTNAYSLLFRSGAIEAVSNIGSVSRENNAPQIFASNLEWPVLSYFGHFIEFLSRYEIEPPFYVLLSLIDVRGYQFIHGRRLFAAPAIMNRDALLFPEIVMQDTGLAAEVVLRPLFDMVWNAFGHPQAFTFDATGKYVGDRW